MRRSVLLVWVSLGWCLAGCALPTPPADLLAQLDAQAKPAPGYQPTQLQVRWESDYLRGRFRGALAAVPGKTPRFRMQLFADIGGKVFDVAGDRDRLVGHFPGTDRAWEHRLPLAATHAQPDPVLLIGITLWESYAPLTRDRILGAEKTEGGWRIWADGLAPGLQLEIETTTAGDVRTRHYTWHRWIQWSETIIKTDDQLHIRIEAPETVIDIEGTREAMRTPVPANLTSLQLPDADK